MSGARFNRLSNLKGPWKVIISIITLWSFLFNIIGPDLAWAARTPLELASVGPDRPDSPPVFKELNVETFSLPAYLGHIKDSWASQLPAPSSQLRTTIIHIQDAHCNYAAQHKISEIIDYLNTAYGVEYINLEGGAKDYDLSIFTRIPDMNVREKVADDFVKEGLVNGAEYYAINNPDKVTLWGVEDVNLYLENLNVYRESLKYKEGVDKHLKALNHILSNLKIHIYSKELLELDARYYQYKADKIEFKVYITYLIKKAKEKLIDIKFFTNIYLLSQALEQEERIDFKKANSERDKVIDRLEKKLSKRGLEELVMRTIEFKAEKISQKDFYIYLVNKAKLVNVELNDFPELQRYIVYISVYDAIDKPKIIDETNVLEAKIKESLYRNDKEKELGILSKNLALLQNIFAISLTRDDYKYYQDNEASFGMRNYISFINKEAPLYKITATLDKNVTDLDRYRQNITKFYDCSLKRDKAFLGNMKIEGHRSEVVGRRVQTAVIVTGGFHTENLCKLFKEQSISYLSIMPNFRNDEGYECPYFSLLAGEMTGLQKRLYSVLSAASSIQIFSMLASNETAARIWGKANIDASRAAVVIAREIAKKRKVIVRVGEGKQAEYYPFGDENSTIEVTMSLQELLDEIHEADNDRGWAKGYKNGFKAVEEYVRLKAADRVDEIATELQNAGQGGRAQKLNAIAMQLRGIGLEINLVNCDDGFEDDEHAGGMGIHINATKFNREYKDKDENTRQGRLISLIVHAAIGSISGDHFAAVAAEQNNIQLAATLLNNTEAFFEKPVWDMAAQERRGIVRDYAQTSLQVTPAAQTLKQYRVNFVGTFPPGMQDMPDIFRNMLSNESLLRRILIDTRFTEEQITNVKRIDIGYGGSGKFKDVYWMDVTLEGGKKGGAYSLIGIRFLKKPDPKLNTVTPKQFIEDAKREVLACQLIGPDLAVGLDELIEANAYLEELGPDSSYLGFTIGEYIPDSKLPQERGLVNGISPQDYPKLFYTVARAWAITRTEANPKGCSINDIKLENFYMDSDYDRVRYLDLGTVTRTGLSGLMDSFFKVLGDIVKLDKEIQDSIKTKIWEEFISGLAMGFDYNYEKFKQEFSIVIEHTKTSPYLKLEIFTSILGSLTALAENKERIEDIFRKEKLKREGRKTRAIEELERKGRKIRIIDQLSDDEFRKAIQAYRMEKVAKRDTLEDSRRKKLFEFGKKYEIPVHGISWNLGDILNLLRSIASGRIHSAPDTRFAHIQVLGQGLLEAPIYIVFKGDVKSVRRDADNGIPLDNEQVSYYLVPDDGLKKILTDKLGGDMQQKGLQPDIIKRLQDAKEKILTYEEFIKALTPASLQAAPAAPAAVSLTGTLVTPIGGGAPQIDIGKKIDELLAGNPELNTSYTKKALEKAVLGEEDLKAVDYIIGIYEAAKAVMINTAFPNEKRTIFIPISDKFCPIEILAKKEAAREWKTLRDSISRRYQFNGLEIVFYDGTKRDLDAKMAKKEGLNQRNTLAYIDEEEWNEQETNELKDKITVFKEGLVPKDELKDGEIRKAYISIGGHVVCAIGVLDGVKNNRTDIDYLTRMSNLITALGINAITPEQFQDMLKNADFRITLPPLNKKDIDRDMANFYLTAEAVMTAL